MNSTYSDLAASQPADGACELHPLWIGPVRLPVNLALAPMAGSTDVVFRTICREFGAGLVITELTSARGICYDPDLKRSWRYLEIDPDAESPVAIQLFGAEPDDFYRAIFRIHEHPVLRRCDLIDLNMGCPVAKVVRSGEGAALMKDPARAARIIEASVRALAEVAAAGGDTGPGSAAGSGIKPLTVKFRKGWDEQSANAPEFARMCQETGASALTIHGRTRDQFYGGQADWSIIAAVRQAVSIPVFGNGDVCDAATARRMFKETGVDGIMIGRAAVGNPWIFQQLQEELSTSMSKSVRRTLLDTVPREACAAVALRHLHGRVLRVGERAGVVEMRPQLAAYLRGTPGAAHWRERVMRAQTEQEVTMILQEWVREPKKRGPGPVLASDRPGELQNSLF